MFKQKPEQRSRDEKVVELDARLTVSEREVLKDKDFAQMTAAEIALAKREMVALRLPFDLVRTRRLMPGDGRSVDLRRTLRAAMRTGGHLVDVKFKVAAEKHPPIVALCDISGSMADYSRLFLHFLHAVSEKGRRVHAFVFATRLTNITRALAPRTRTRRSTSARRLVKDWDGGTRIAHCLERFNKDWSRRVLGQGAVVLLITDGLERSVDEGLGARWTVSSAPAGASSGSTRSCASRRSRRAPPASRRCCPIVDEFRSIHNLESMGDLVRALGRERRGRRQGRDPRASARRSAAPRDRRRGAFPHATSRERMIDRDILAKAEAWRESGKGVAIATVVETWGSAPRPRARTSSSTRTATSWARCRAAASREPSSPRRST